MSDTDALFDASPEAISARVARFKSRCEETPLERAMHTAAVAVEDLDAAIWLAKTRPELREARAEAEKLIARLIITSSVALTRDELMDFDA